MLALMIVPVLCFSAWAFVMRGPQKTGVHIDSVMFSSIEIKRPKPEPFVAISVFVGYGGVKPDWWGSNDHIHMWPRELVVISPNGQKSVFNPSGMHVGTYVRFWRKYEVTYRIRRDQMKYLKDNSLEIVVDINSIPNVPPFHPVHNPQISPYRNVVKTVVKIPDEYTQ